MNRAVPLLILLLFCEAAAAPLSTEKAYREARAALDRGDTGAAEAKTEAALARAGKTDDEWVWALRVLKAYIDIRNDPEARTFLERALPARYRNSEAAVWRLIALATADYSSNPEAALARVEEARKIAEAKQPRLLFSVCLTLATIDGANAEAHLRKALELARRDGDWIGIALVRAAMNFRYVRAGQYVKAIDAGRKALATFEALHMPGRAATAAGNLAWAYQQIGDWETAADLFARAEANALRAGSISGRVRWENQLGNVYAVQRRYADAERMFLRALEHDKDLTSTERVWPLANLARVALDTGKIGNAQRYIAQAMQSQKNPDQEIFVHIIDARLAMVTGQHARAETTLRDAISKAKGGLKWMAQGYLAQLYALTQRHDLAEAAYRNAIRTASDARKTVKGSLELSLSFFNNASEIFNSYVDFLVRNHRFEDALAATESIRGQTLEEGLGIRVAQRKPDFRAIAKNEGATILSYWLDRERSHLWVVTAARVTYHQLPPDSAIIREASAYRRDLAGRYGTLQGSGARGQQLYRMLVEPANVAKGSRVIVVADGLLHALNFETLVVPAPKPHYWIEDAIISSAISLQLLAQAEPKKSGGDSILVVGDPTVADAAFPKLANAAQEIQSVEKHFDRAVVLARTKATPEAYRAAAREKFAYVHFVAHGVSSRLRPLESAVILGRDQSKEYKLYARDIVMRPLDARLVTISSCYGAGERTFAGEGLVGLAWAFQRAGAHQVIAALWEVNDSATPKLMDLMYGGIRAGRDPAVALRDAKLALINGKDAHSRPRYWAPFVLYSGN